MLKQKRSSAAYYGILVLAGALYALMALSRNVWADEAYTFAMLRHSFASVAITNGADIASVSEKLGHSDKAVTLRMYTHADEASISRASDIFREAIKNKKNMEDKDGRTDG